MEQELKKKDKELMTAMRAVSAAEAASKEKDARIAELEVQLSSSQDEIVRLNKKVLEAQQCYESTVLKQKEALGEQKNAHIQKIRDALPTSLDKLYRYAVVDYKTRLFHSPVGQQFLRTLREKLLDAYLHTPELLDKVGSMVLYFIEVGNRMALKQIKASPEQYQQYDLNLIVKYMDFRSIETHLGVNRDVGPEWWMPVLDQVVEYLIMTDLQEGGDSQALEHNLPCLRKLQPARVLELQKSVSTKGVCFTSSEINKLLKDAEAAF